MRSAQLWLGLAGSALGFVAVRRFAQRNAHDPQVSLAREDERFHRAYDAAREDAAQHAPALVLFGGKFIFSDLAQRSEYSVSAPASQLLKAAAHAPLGVFALLSPCLANSDHAPLPVSLQARLSRSEATLRKAESDLRADAGSDGLTDEARGDSVEVLQMTREFISQTLTTQRISARGLSQLARALGPRLLRLTEHATELELSALHAATEAALADMTPEQRRTFEVVVAGAHQARDRSLALQYFRHRLGEEPGEEHRVAFAESVGGPDEARSLVGTRRIDRDIAAAFFGNPKRLQRDVLGDAAAHLLEQRAFSRIGAAPSEADSAATNQRSCPSAPEVTG